MALSDWLARIYLARLLCKLVFAGAVGGPQKQFLWRVLLRLAFSQKEKPHVCFDPISLPSLLLLIPLGPCFRISALSSLSSIWLRNLKRMQTVTIVPL